VSDAGRSLERLKKRRDFLAAAKGRKAGRPSFVLEMRRRDDDGALRVGFTVSKRTAKKAVERNRIRRRLKEAVRQVAPAVAEPGCDYVLVGRVKALTARFSTITADLAGALAEIAAPASARRRAPARSEGR
jgi:ribonuclease P protein component